MRSAFPLSYSDFDLDGNPHTTVQTRFNGHSGLSSAPQVLDAYKQTHQWNAHHERSSWTMPRGADGTPIDNNWTDSVSEGHDPAGNVSTISRVQFGPGGTSTLMTGSFRNAGRPDSRTVTTNCTGNSTCSPTLIVRTYGYDAAPGKPTGQLDEMSVTINSSTTPVAGSHVDYNNGTQMQIGSLQLLGISSNERYSRFAYDDRSRLSGSVFATSDPSANPVAPVPGQAAEALSPADFRTAEPRTPRLDAATRSILAGKGINVTAIDPTAVSAQELAAHRIDKATANLQI